MSGIHDAANCSRLIASGLLGRSEAIILFGWASVCVVRTSSIFTEILIAVQYTIWEILDVENAAILAQYKTGTDPDRGQSAQSSVSHDR